MSTGWICPKCGRVYAPFVMECSHCNNNEIKPDPCMITLPGTQDYSKYKSEATTDLGKCDQRVTIDDEQLKYTTSSTFNNEYVTYTHSGTQPTIATTTTQDLKLDKDPVYISSQMICDSQGCREVDLLGRPIKPIDNELKTSMSLEQFKELVERIPARDEDVRESSFEVMLEDDVLIKPSSLIYKCSACGKTYNGKAPDKCECDYDHDWIVLNSTLPDNVNKALELYAMDKIKEDIRQRHSHYKLDKLPDWAEVGDGYILKVEYDDAGVTHPSANCANAKWECPKCRSQFYDFPYKGCFCGAKGEEMLQIAE